MSVKQEVNGVGEFVPPQSREAGDVLEVSAPRGAFTLRPGDGPVVLASAGIGATPVLAMLHALAAIASPREVWWLYGARNRNEHPFAKESRELLQALAHAVKAMSSTASPSLGINSVWITTPRAI